uniref:Uncharacterized protein n=1 Tax=Strombidium rassoulzadegani TaxID=1082188 RepID=A0A7S3CJU0_9SPIT|mmetsp:Transcript_13575/g.23101  ORF Transcript_13575/g.23101 Transcript_13575/m.23101 type:complete len:232 (+) Transcript_13575:419-1114(+)
MFDHVEKEDMKSGSMATINMQFNTLTNEVKVSSDALDVKGEPLYEFVMNTDTGVMRQTKRDALSSHEKVVERELEPSKFSAKTAAPAKEQSTFDESTVIDQYDDLDAQRDLAFKIVYFFIVFIVITFGLLYVYFRMHQSEVKQEQERKQRASRAKNAQFSNLAAGNEDTFFDFLVGQMDYEKNPVNPKANPYFFNKQAEKQCESSSRASSGRFDHRQNEGFGTNNLDTLGE